MRHDKPTEEIQEQAALYALGALSQHEARAFETHLREGCPVCALEVSKYEDVADRLGLTIDPVTPPDYLGELLEARLRREPRPEPANAPAPQERQTQMDPVRKNAGSWRIYLPWAAAVSFAVLAVLSYFSLSQIRSEIAAQQQRLATLQNESDNLQAVIEREKTRSRELEQIRDTVSRRGSRVIILEGQEAAPSASGAIFWDTERKRCLVSADLPPAPPGKVYQLWFVTSTAKTSAGLIETDSSGHAFVTLDAPEGVAGFGTAAVTLEPSGGSAKPTVPIYAMGKPD